MERVSKDYQIVERATNNHKAFPVKAIIAGAIGNTVEWVDWAIYGLASPFIAAQFFPSDDPAVGLMQTFGVFALGFLIRPVGAMVLGPYGDKHGRNKALALSIILMAIGTGAIGALPTYAQIGLWAPLLLLVLRLMQGFAAGGEWGIATSFLYEYAPLHRRAFFSSFRPVGTGLGTFIGGFIITLITTFFAADTITQWAWRIPFGIAFVIGFIGLYIRLHVEESPEFEKTKESDDLSEHPLADAVKNDQRGLLITFGLTLVWNVVFYVLFTYMPTYLKTVIHVPLDVSMQTNSISTIFYTVMILVFGWLADKYNKRTMLLISCGGFLFLTYPAFLLIGSGDFMTILGVQCLFGLLMAIFSGAVPVVIVEQFPTRTRSTAVSTAYTFNVSLFGGTAPLVATYLTTATGSAIAPAFYMMLCTFFTILAVLKCRNQ
jgi:MHS family proline/betaine transporter-like MFS transporter